VDDAIDDLATIVTEADSTVALTGAGVSKASGVPTYRGADGVWDQFDRMAFHRRRFEADPAGFWEDRVALRAAMYPDGRPAPNIAHEALASLESMGQLDAILTQNVDGLHTVAGSESVMQLHGTDRLVRCEACDGTIKAATAFAEAREGTLPPPCSCGGVYRPAVVLFGEELRGDTISRANAHVRDADCLLALGSSLTVRPAARLPAVATETGATLAVINLDATPYDEQADIVIQQDLTAVLPALVKAVGRN
jgi:NAD-dependent deacetylase